MAFLHFFAFFCVSLRFFCGLFAIASYEYENVNVILNHNCTRSVLLLKVSVCKFANFETPKIHQNPLRMLDFSRLHMYGRPAGRPAGRPTERLPLQNPRFCRVDFTYFRTRNMHKNP